MPTICLQDGRPLVVALMTGSKLYSYTEYFHNSKNKIVTAIKLEKNWRHQTLENLEKDYWGSAPDDSYLVKRVHEIRKLPLSSLTNDDIAMMLRQKFSLDYIVPLAIDKLEEDILAHGDTGSEGAIMEAIVGIPADFWKLNTSHWETIKKILDDGTSRWTFKRDNFDRSVPR